jgi:tripartite-type tricarboxylate transporter receptor subunit TctC
MRFILFLFLSLFLIYVQAQTSLNTLGSMQFVVPSSAGTTGDQLARLLGSKLTTKINVPVVVENKVGAGGLIGIDYVAKANPDGKTLLFSATAFSTLAALRNDLPYDPVKNFSSVVLLGTSPLVFVVTNSVPAKNIREFLDFVIKQPAGTVNYASPGVGSVHHLTSEMFLQETGLKLTHIPYKASASLINDIVAGHVQSAFVVLQTATQMVVNGKMRMLAVMGQNRIPQFPNTPTMIESGVQIPPISAWFGISAPANTPSSIVFQLNHEINQILVMPETRASIIKMGVDPVGGKSDKLDSLIKQEIKIWSQVVKKGEISIE